MITRRAKGVEPVAALLYKHVMNIFNETDTVTMEIRHAGHRAYNIWDQYDCASYTDSKFHVVQQRLQPYYIEP